MKRELGVYALAMLGILILWPAAGCTSGPGLDAEADALRALHERVLAAHRSGDVESWMAVEADDYISANGGTITYPSLVDRRSRRESYLSATTFSVYRDLTPPVVRVSADGSMGWVVAEVEMKGTQLDEGVETPMEGIWAWIELYEKQSGSWKLVGNVSNRRP